MERVTFDGDFCDIAQCRSVKGGKFCRNEPCSQYTTWYALKSYEDKGVTPDDILDLRNELCVLCGKFKDAHLGACDKCRWKDIGMNDMPEDLKCESKKPLTIDEAIAHAKEVAETRTDLCDDCRREHKQLEEWLTELKAYKGTGMTPEEAISIKHAFMGKKISEITEFDGVPIKRMQELAQAEKERRIAVFNDPRLPLVWEGKEHVAILCPSCRDDLMGGFPLAQSDVAMYQCPHCGQPIDATKVMTREEADERLKGGIDS